MRAAQKLGLLYIKERGGRHCLCKELQNYNFDKYPLGIKIIFVSSSLKGIKAFLADLAKKKERKEQNKLIEAGIVKRAEFLANAKLKPANNEPSLFDFDDVS